jgi:hypothetical protein
MALHETQHSRDPSGDDDDDDDDDNNNNNTILPTIKKSTRI